MFDQIIKGGTIVTSERVLEETPAIIDIPLLNRLVLIDTTSFKNKVKVVSSVAYVDLLLGEGVV